MTTTGARPLSVRPTGVVVWILLACGAGVLLTDRRRRLFTDEVARQRVVAPTDVWVIGEHPLGTVGPALTLMTCNTRFSAEQRLIVHAELVS